MKAKRGEFITLTNRYIPTETHNQLLRERDRCVCTNCGSKQPPWQNNCDVVHHAKISYTLESYCFKFFKKTYADQVLWLGTIFKVPLVALFRRISLKSAWRGSEKINMFTFDIFGFNRSSIIVQLKVKKNKQSVWWLTVQWYWNQSVVEKERQLFLNNQYKIIHIWHFLVLNSDCWYQCAYVVVSSIYSNVNFRLML